MSETSLFDAELPLPDDGLAQKAKTLIGFDERYQAVHAQLRLLLNSSDLPAWNTKFHHGKLNLGALLQEQYPFAIFHGDVGTGKTATAETIANRLVAEARVEDATLFKMSNRVRGSGMVGEMGTLISQAFQQVIKAVGKNKRAILIIDEGDSSPPIGRRNIVTTRTRSRSTRSSSTLTIYAGSTGVFSSSFARTAFLFSIQRYGGEQLLFAPFRDLRRKSGELFSAATLPL